MISIITPAHKVIPWHNARLINICEQDSDNWEWVILDNSKDGCVKDYVERFFIEMQGVNYPHCKDKIKVYHEPQFADITIVDGKMGKMCNRLVELSECGDDGFFLRLDFDDFLFKGCIRMLTEAIEAYPETEFVTGQLCNNLCQKFSDGEFYYNDGSASWYVVPENQLQVLIHEGFGEIEGFNEFAENIRNNYRNIAPRYLVDCPSEIEIPNTGLVFYGRNVLTLRDGWGMFGVPEHPLCVKKGAFIEKLGGFVTDNTKEDLNRLSYPLVFNEQVWIDNPLYMRCFQINDSLQMCGTTNIVREQCNYENEYYYKARTLKAFYEKYGLYGKVIPHRIKF